MKVTFSIIFILAFTHENEGSECDKSKVSLETKLRQALFCNYDKMVRPVENVENQTLVQFQLYPTKIYMDEHEEVITFRGNILYVWSDSFLTWDPKEYEGILFIRVSSSEIWVPDISVDTWSHSTSSFLVTNNADCHLAHGGDLYCFVMTTLQAPCTPDITTFPFDTQNCTLTFSSSGFLGKYINFTLFEPKNGVKMTLYRPNKFWDLKQATARREVKYLSLEDESISYPLIRCSFILRRHSAGHAAILVLPAAVLIALSLSIFWMDTLYVIRIGLAAVVILCDVLYSIYLGVILPSNGDRVPVIVTFFRDSFLMAAFSILVTLLVRHFSVKAKPAPHWLSQILLKMESVHVIRTIFLGEKAGGEEDVEEIIERPKKNSSWVHFAIFVDRLAFFLCCFVYAVLLVFYLP